MSSTLTPSNLSANVTNPIGISNELSQYGEVQYEAKDLMTGIRCSSSIPRVLSALELTLQSVSAQLVLGCFDWGSSVVKNRILQPGQLGLKPDSAVERLGSLVQEAALYLHTTMKWQSGFYDIWAHQPRCQVPHGNEFIRPSGWYNHFNRKASWGREEEGR